MLWQPFRVVRDSPNLIVPTLATCCGPAAGTAWAWGAYAQLVASLAYPFLLLQIQSCLTVGEVVAGDSTSFINILANIEVATGAADSEVTKATAIDGSFAYGMVSGVVDDVVAISFCASSVGEIPVGPIVIPASTRIAMRVALSSAPTTRNARFFLSGYNLTDPPRFVSVPGVDQLHELGSRPLTTAPLVSLEDTTITTGATWTMGNYAEVEDSLADDMLILGGVAVYTGAPPSRQAQIEVALGAAGSEIVQARFSLPIGTQSGIGLVRWPYPFLARKGERVAVRGACNTATKTYDIILYGVRLS